MHYLVKAMAFAAVAMTTPRIAAQDDPDGRLALHVDGLTGEMRDAIALDLAVSNTFRIRYACVPAGILVIEAVAHARQVDPARDVVAAHAGSRRITAMASSDADLEALCANTRGQ